MKTTPDLAVGIHTASLLLFSIAHPGQIINYSGKLVPKVLKYLKAIKDLSNRESLFEKLLVCQKAVVGGGSIESVSSEFEYLKQYFGS